MFVSTYFHLIHGTKIVERKTFDAIENVVCFFIRFIFSFAFALTCGLRVCYFQDTQMFIKMMKMDRNRALYVGTVA